MNEDLEVTDEMLDHLEVLMEMDVLEEESGWEIANGPEGEGHE